jgi:hypothetical protein
MHVHLLVPDAFVPEAEFPAGLRPPALETLMARGRRERTAAHSCEAWLKDRFAVEGQGFAAFALLAQGIQPGDAYWMSADPVHLRIGHNTPLLADSEMFDLSLEEAAQLVARLNAHFGDELQIVSPVPQRWYARPSQAPDLQFTPLSQARGQPIAPHLPAGADAMRWHALMNEAQMVLHGHAVNEAREARGALPVNSLWLWGGGRLEAPAAQPFEQVLGNSPLARGLAQASGAAALPLPGNTALWLEEDAPTSGRVLIVLEALSPPLAYGDGHDWESRLAGLESAWFMPLLAALRRGRIGMITLHSPSATGTLSAETVRTDLHRFWRRRKPLSRYTHPVS